LTGELDKNDFVLDYGELWKFKKMIDEKLDHKHLNDVFEFKTTAENIAKWFYGFAKSIWPKVSAVRVSETPKTWAEYRED